MDYFNFLSKYISVQIKAYYGSIGSFEGTQAFDDMIKHEKLKSWFDAMKEMVTNSKGVVYLNNMKVKN